MALLADDTQIAQGKTPQEGVRQIPLLPAGKGGLMPLLTRHAGSLLAAFSLLLVSVGCGIERLSLAFIVPGAIMFGCLAAGRLLGGRSDGE